MQEMKETWIQSLGWEDPLEKEIATHCSFLAWKSQGQRSLAGYSPWGPKESDMTEHTIPPKYPISNVVIVSGGQQKDSTTHMCVSILSQAPLPSRLPHNIEQSSMCCTVGPCWLSILNTAVYTHPYVFTKWTLCVHFPVLLGTALSLFSHHIVSSNTQYESRYLSL